MSADTGTRNIVILGAGFAGQSAAHYYLRHIHPSLKLVQKENANYKIILVDQSNQFWWHISAPRAMVSTKAMPHDKTFVPIMKGFEQYVSAKDAVEFKQANPVNIDTARRTVTVKSISGDSAKDVNAGMTDGDTNGAATNPALVETISYYALVIATGTRTPTPVTSFHGDHTRSMRALDAMNERLATAKNVVIAGGGPVGVETAGEIGDAMNGSAGFLKARPAKEPVKITLVAGGSKLLPVLRKGLSDKAEKFLNKVGVDVVYNAKVARVDMPEQEDGKTTVHFDGGSGREPIQADVYISATGVTPNTEFVPKALLNERGYVKTNPSTLRVDEAGPRVYCLGDVGSYTRGGVLDLFSAAPALGSIIAFDLGVIPGTGQKAEGSKGKGTKDFKTDTSESQLVPIGRKQGVGAFKGFKMPSRGVTMMKGKDYFLSTMKDTTWGNKYAKP